MKRILIIEDEEMLAELLEEAVAEAGFDVCGVARSVKDAVALGRLHRPELAIVDVHLIDGLGTTVAQFLVENYNTGILYVTSDVEALKSAVGHACLPKPFRLARLKRALDLVVEIVAGTRERMSGIIRADRDDLLSRPS